MGKIKILSIIIIILMSVYNVFGQNYKDTINLKKYWNYRDRFRKLFVKIGTEKGCSIPISTRNTDAPCNDSFDRNEIGLGDGTAYIGRYIAMLATEYKLLKDANQSTQNTLNELYYAIYTLHRLDRSAERYLHNVSNYPDQLDGFTIRDDIPIDFWRNWRKKSWGDINTANGDASRTMYYDYDEHQCKSWTYNKKNEMSQDQSLNMLWGLCFVKKYVDNVYIQPTNNDSGVYIVDYAAEWAEKEIEYFTRWNTMFTNDFKFKKYGDSIEYKYTLVSNYIIQSPVGPVDLFPAFNFSHYHRFGPYVSVFDYFVSNKLKDYTTSSNGGGISYAFAYPISEMASYITGKAHHKPLYLFQNSQYDVSNITYSSNTVDSVTYEELKSEWFRINMLPYKILADYGDGRLDDSVHNTFKLFLDSAHVIMAPNIIAKVFDDVNVSLFCIPASVVNMNLNNSAINTLLHLNYLQNTSDYYAPVFELAYCLFHNRTSYYTDSFFRELFYKAPFDSMNRDDTISGWCWGGFRWFHHPKTGTHIYDEGTGKGSSCGIDYMIAYNLYHLMWDSLLPPYQYEEYYPTTESREGLTVLKGITTLTTHYTHDDFTPRFDNAYDSFGIPLTEYLIHDVNVQDGGNLDVKYRLDVCNKSTLRINDEGQFNIGGTGTLKHGEVRIRKGSTLILEGTGSHPAQLFIDDSSVLTIDEGAVLQIYGTPAIILNGPHARLVIKGTLKLMDDAVFTTLPDAKGQGYVRFEQNSYLWDNLIVSNTTNNALFILQGADSTVKLMETAGSEGLRVDDHLKNFIIKKGRVEMYNTSRINIGSPISLQNAWILGDNAYNTRGINLYGQTNTIRHVRFENLGIGLWLNTWYLYNTYNPSQRKKYYIKPAHCIFVNNNAGIYANGSNIYTDSCTFSKNLTGITGEKMLLNTWVHHTVMDSTTYNNIYFDGSGISSLRLSHSGLYHVQGSDEAIKFRGGQLWGGCNEIFSDSDTYSPLYNTGVYLYKNSALCLSKRWHRGWTGTWSFAGFQSDIQTETNIRLYLDSGYNNFSNDISGLHSLVFDKGTCSDDTFRTTLLDTIICNYNHWDNGNSNAVRYSQCGYDTNHHNLLSYSKDSTLINNSWYYYFPKKTKFTDNNTLSMTLGDHANFVSNHCSVPPNEVAPGAWTTDKTGYLINMQIYNAAPNLRIDKAVTQTFDKLYANNNMDFTGAIADFKSILLYPYDFTIHTNNCNNCNNNTNPNPNWACDTSAPTVAYVKKQTLYYLDVAYTAMKEALSSGIDSGTIGIVRGESSPEAVNHVIEVMDTLFVRLPNDSAHYEKRFEYALDKATTLRLAERRAEAIAVINDLITWVHTEDSALVASWQCQINKEIDILANTYSFAEADSVYHCSLIILPQRGEQSAPLMPAKNKNTTKDNNIKQVTVSSTLRNSYPFRSTYTTPQGITIFPNPAKDEINVQLRGNPSSPMYLQIMSPSGSTLFSQTYTEPASTIKINTQSLTGGIYYLTITNRESIWHNKFVIVR